MKKLIIYGVSYPKAIEYGSLHMQFREIIGIHERVIETPVKLIHAFLSAN